MKHTPTPWIVRGAVLIGEEDTVVCSCSEPWEGEADEANAAFIARACNAFDELLSIVKQLALTGECTCQDLGIGGGLCDVCRAKDAVRRAEADHATI